MSRPTSPSRRRPRFRERSPLGVAPASSSSPPTSSAEPAKVWPLPSRSQASIHRASLPAVSREQALYLVLLAGGFLVRIWDVGSRAMHGDEAVHAWTAWNLFTGVGYQYDPVYHGPLQFLVTTVLFFLFGVSNTTGRLMAVLFGAALVVLPYFLRDRLGRVGALLGSAFIAFSPAFVYFSRFERNDIFTAFFAFTMAIALFGFVRSHQVRYFYLGAASIALSLAAKENTYITLFVFGSFILLTLLAEYSARRQIGKDRLDRLAALTSGPVPFSWMGGFAVLLGIAIVATVASGRVWPVPLVVALGLIALVLRQAAASVAVDRRSPFLEAVSSLGRSQWINGLTIIAAVLLLTYSTVGTNLNGIWDSAHAFFNLNGQACAGNNFPLNPCRKDLIGGLFYWLSQDHVARGGQPWFYFTFLFGLYEQIAVVFGIGGIIYFLRKPSLFTTFLTFWAVVMFAIYSWAGEKFPWLMIHPLLPFLLLSSMFVAAVFRTRGAWRIVVAIILAGLSLLELHSTFEVNFVNGANPVEMMVYTQSAPDTPKVAADILNLSHKATLGPNLHVSIDSLDTWPFAWYLRDMPNVGYPSGSQLMQKPYVSNPVIIVDAGDQPALYPKIRHDYTGRRYHLRWWFPEDYKSLSWQSAASRAVNPGYWNVIWQWLIDRRPFGPRGSVDFYYYVKNNLVSPY